MRSTSGKFSLSAFGRKDHGSPSSAPDPGSPNQSTGFQGQSDGPESPGRETNGFDGIGKKLGKSLAHNSLLPSLGNKDVRALQDVIAAEKGVLQAMDRLAQETEKAAATLPAYGAQEGPDLQDILGHSSTLLTSLASALQVFVGHENRMRTTLKKIREREEGLSEMRSRRRNTGSKAEREEKKLAKMGSENKALPSQTDLLEKLRQEMRQLDTDIVTEESKLGDFKRQIVKESMSLKFGGLEELGEKMCIIGELGKLLLEEVPLEETPPGYGRAPYQGFEKTENAVNEAQKCLATVQFHSGSTAPKAPALPNSRVHAPLTPSLNHTERIAAAQDYGHYPANAASPPTPHGRRQQYGLDDNPYGGMADIHGNAQPSENHAYREYGGTRPEGQVVWQGPTDEALHPPTGYGGEPQALGTGEKEHGYEYEQAAAAAAAEEASGQEGVERNSGAPQLPALAVDGGGLGGEQAEWRTSRDQNQNTIAPGQLSNAPTPSIEAPPSRGWEPLNLKREVSRNTDTAPSSAPEIPAVNADTQYGGAVGDVTTTDPSHPAPEGEYAYHHQSVASVIPPPPMSANVDTREGSADGYHTPLEAPPPIPAAANPARPASPIGIGSIVPPSGSGKISAAAFRRGVKPRLSADDAELSSPTSPLASTAGGDGGLRRLPIPPPGAPEFPPGTATAGVTATGYPDEKSRGSSLAPALEAPLAGQAEPHVAFADAPEASGTGANHQLTPEELAARGPPPSYVGTSGPESLR